MPEQLPKDAVAAFTGAWLAEVLANDCEGQAWLKNDTLYLRAMFMVAGQRWVEAHAVSLIEFRSAAIDPAGWSRIGKLRGESTARTVRLERKSGA